MMKKGIKNTYKYECVGSKKLYSYSYGTRLQKGFEMLNDDEDITDDTPISTFCSYSRPTSTNMGLEMAKKSYRDFLKEEKRKR
jgi:hypothetical protein